jgi:hypothetical protein
MADMNEALTTATDNILAAYQRLKTEVLALLAQAGTSDPAIQAAIDRMEASESDFMSLTQQVHDAVTPPQP